MLHEVMIDGIKYVPQATIQPTDDATLRAALHELVSLHYFGNWHKAQGSRRYRAGYRNAFARVGEGDGC